LFRIYAGSFQQKVLQELLNPLLPAFFKRLKRHIQQNSAFPAAYSPKQIGKRQSLRKTNHADKTRKPQSLFLVIGKLSRQLVAGIRCCSSAQSSHRGCPKCGYGGLTKTCGPAKGAYHGACCHEWYAASYAFNHLNNEVLPRFRFGRE